jgi:hypothetical protein
MSYLPRHSSRELMSDLESRCGTQGQAMVEMRYEVVSTPTTGLQLSSASVEEVEGGGGREEEGLRTSISDVCRLKGQASIVELWVGPNGL